GAALFQLRRRRSAVNELPAELLLLWWRAAIRLGEVECEPTAGGQARNGLRVGEFLVCLQLEYRTARGRCALLTTEHALLRGNPHGAIRGLVQGVGGNVVERLGVGL